MLCAIKTAGGGAHSAKGTPVLRVAALGGGLLGRLPPRPGGPVPRGAGGRPRRGSRAPRHEGALLFLALTSRITIGAFLNGIRPFRGPFVAESTPKFATKIYQNL